MNANETERISTIQDLWARFRDLMGKILRQTPEDPPLDSTDSEQEFPEDAESTPPINTLPDGAIDGASPPDTSEDAAPPQAETDATENQEISGETEAGTLVLEEDTCFLESISLGMWISMGVALFFAVLSTVMTVLWLRSRRRKKRAANAPIKPTIFKLHEQGAREYQQDCFFVSPEQYYGTYGLLTVVADGMGGMADGDRFSETAVRAMMNQFLVTPGAPDDVLNTLLTEANRAVNRLMADSRIGRGGSTLVAGLLKDGRFHYRSIGDSRIALFRDGCLYQLNREHVFHNELLTAAINGEMSLREAAAHPKAAGLVSYLGMGQLKYIDFPAESVAVRPGDRLLLMTDGVYNALPEAELIQLLSTSGNPADHLRTAISGKAYRNQDNYTAVIIDC